MKPHLIAAHTQVQIDLLLQNHRIPRDHVRRVRDWTDVAARNRDRPLYLLPGWYEVAETARAVKEWQARGGEVVEISEDVVLGRAPSPIVVQAPAAEDGIEKRPRVKLTTGQTIERARAIRRLVVGGRTPTEIGAVLGISQQLVSFYIRKSKAMERVGAS